MKYLFIFILYFILFDFNANAQNYNLGNTVAEAGWFKLGRLYLPQQGAAAEIKVIAGNGYNALTGQQGECSIHFRTSNGNSNSQGFFGSGSFYNTGDSRIFSAVRVIQIDLATWDFYAILPGYTGSYATLTLKAIAGTWESGFGKIDPPTGVVSLDLTEQLVFASPISFTQNMGIGTKEASEKLVVNGNLKLILDQGTFPQKNVVSLLALGYSGATGAKNWALRSVYAHWNGVGYNADGGDLDVIKSLDGSTILATKTDGTALGNVGIGTTAPTERLNVNGKIKASEIRVDGAGAPDYVFEPGYKVATLEALESYIKANKHLPEVPSAKEFERDGIAVGEMNKLLLKKIEELTLHVIELNKRMEKVEEENRKLKKNGN